MKKNRADPIRQNPFVPYLIAALILVAAGTSVAVHELVYALIQLPHLLDVVNATYLLIMSIMLLILLIKQMIQYPTIAIGKRRWRSTSVAIITLSIAASLLSGRESTANVAQTVFIATSYFMLWIIFIIMERKYRLPERFDRNGIDEVIMRESPPYVYESNTDDQHMDGKELSKTETKSDFLRILDEIIAWDSGISDQSKS